MKGGSPRSDRERVVPGKNDKSADLPVTPLADCTLTRRLTKIMNRVISPVTAVSLNQRPTERLLLYRDNGEFAQRFCNRFAA